MNISLKLLFGTDTGNYEIYTNGVNNVYLFSLRAIQSRRQKVLDTFSISTVTTFVGIKSHVVCISF